MPRNKIIMRAIIIFMLIPGSIMSIGLSRGSLCLTPNGEPAYCTGINSCEAFQEQTMLQIPGVLEFIQMSLCGYDNREPLVCCGTRAFKTDIVVSCVTPNYENATCLPLSSCPIIRESMQDRTEESKAFVTLSQCGYGKEPHVCCGTKGTFYETRRFLPPVSKCGINSKTISIYNSPQSSASFYYVMGGKKLALGDFPWTALIRYKYSDGEDAGFKCGGSLINNRYVVTAGHCVMINPVMDYDIDTIRLGEWTISTTVDCFGDDCVNAVVDLGIAKVVVHPKYSRAKKINDIALIRLDREVEYTDYIRPVCLPTHGSPMPKHGTKMLVTGWGITENGKPSDTKLYVFLPAVSNDKCSNMLEGYTKITDHHMCAGGEEGRDACQGDSGGALMGMRNMIGDYQFYLEGVVSWGIQCGVSRFPGIYTRVPMYVQWIIDHLEK